MIRDRIWKSKKLRRCSLTAALAYPWIFLVADEWGRFEYDARSVWSEAFSAREDVKEEDVSSWLAEYAREGLLVRYHIDGDLAYWTNFEGRPPSKRRESNYPDPEQFDETVRWNAGDRQQELEQETGAGARDKSTGARAPSRRRVNKPSDETDSPERRAVVDAYNAVFGSGIGYTPGNLSAAGRALAAGYSLEHCRDVFKAVKAGATVTAKWCRDNNREFEYLIRPTYRHIRTQESTQGPLDKIPNEIATGRKQAS